MVRHDTRQLCNITHYVCHANGAKTIPYLLHIIAKNFVFIYKNKSPVSIFYSILAVERFVNAYNISYAMHYDILNA